MENVGTPLHIFAVWVLLGLLVSLVWGKWVKSGRDE